MFIFFNDILINTCHIHYAHLSSTKLVDGNRIHEVVVCVENYNSGFRKKYATEEEAKLALYELQEFFNTGILK